MFRAFFIVLVAITVFGCATTPRVPVSELRQQVGKTLFVQHGEKPLRYSTGVIDTASFWGAYGDGVATQTGGWLWSDLASSGRQESAEKRLSNAELVERLYSDHPMIPVVSEQVLPAMADLWQQPFSSRNTQVVPANTLTIKGEARVLNGLQTDADLVLVLSVDNINLTERFSMGAAFASGFTMGTNEKSLTTEVSFMMRGFKRDAAGQLVEVWFQPCGTNYTTMDTSYYLKDLVDSKANMTEILDEATGQSIDSCTEVLGILASQ